MSLMISSASMPTRPMLTGASSATGLGAVKRGRLRSLAAETPAGAYSSSRSSSSELTSSSASTSSQSLPTASMCTSVAGSTPTVKSCSLAICFALRSDPGFSEVSIKSRLSESGGYRTAADCAVEEVEVGAPGVFLGRPLRRFVIGTAPAGVVDVDDDDDDVLTASSASVRRDMSRSEVHSGFGSTCASGVRAGRIGLGIDTRASRVGVCGLVPFLCAGSAGAGSTWIGVSGLRLVPSTVRRMACFERACGVLAKLNGDRFSLFACSSSHRSRQIVLSFLNCGRPARSRCLPSLHLGEPLRRPSLLATARSTSTSPTCMLYRCFARSSSSTMIEVETSYLVLVPYTACRSAS
jgi:hypothetical protein